MVAVLEISYFKVKPLLKLEITAPSRRSVTMPWSMDGESTLRILAGLQKVTMKIQDWIQFSQNILTFPGTRTLWQGAGSPGLTISITFSSNNTRNKSFHQKWRFGGQLRLHHPLLAREGPPDPIACALPPDPAQGFQSTLCTMAPSAPAALLA